MRRITQYDRAISVVVGIRLDGSRQLVSFTRIRAPEGAACRAHFDMN